MDKTKTARVKKAGSRRPCDLGTAAAALLLLGTVAAGPAWADPPFFVQASAEADVGVFITQDDTGQVQTIPAAVRVSATGDPFSPDDTASANAVASLGSLAAFAAATVVDGVFVLGRTNARWSDTFIATSSNPSVTQVTFQVTVSLFDTIAASANTVGEAHAALVLSDSAHMDGLRLISLDDASYNPPLEPRTVTAPFTEPVGVPFRLSGTLLVFTAAGDRFGEMGTINVDASHAFNLAVLTPEGAYTTASGFSY